VLIALGVAWALHGICGSRLVPSWTPAEERDPRSS
jgi:hypothetical protein